MKVANRLLGFARAHFRDPLLALVLVSAILPTIAVYRAAVQPDYQWGYFFIGGAGVGPDYWILLATASACWLLLAFGFLRPGMPYPILLVAWAAGGSALLAYGSIDKNLALRGDAWSIRLDAGWPVAALATAVLICSIVYAIAEARAKEPTSPRERLPVPRALTAASVALTPFIVILFRLGNGQSHTLYDRVAIALVIVQSVMVASVLRRSAAAKTAASTGPVVREGCEEV